MASGIFLSVLFLFIFCKKGLTGEISLTALGLTRSACVNCFLLFFLEFFCGRGKREGSGGKTNKKGENKMKVYRSNNKHVISETPVAGFLEVKRTIGCFLSVHRVAGYAEDLGFFGIEESASVIAANPGAYIRLVTESSPAMEEIKEAENASALALAGRLARIAERNRTL